MSILGFSKPRPVEGEESEGEEAVERQCVECQVSLTNGSTMGHPVYDVLLSVDLATPLSVHPSYVTISSIGELFPGLFVVLLVTSF